MTIKGESLVVWCDDQMFGGNPNLNVPFADDAEQGPRTTLEMDVACFNLGEWLRDKYGKRFIPMDVLNSHDARQRFPEKWGRVEKASKVAWIFDSMNQTYGQVNAVRELFQWALRSTCTKSIVVFSAEMNIDNAANNQQLINALIPDNNEENAKLRQRYEEMYRNRRVVFAYKSPEGAQVVMKCLERTFDEEEAA